MRKILINKSKTHQMEITMIQ